MAVALAVAVGGVLPAPTGAQSRGGARIVRRAPVAPQPFVPRSSARLSTLILLLSRADQPPFRASVSITITW